MTVITQAYLARRLHPKDRRAGPNPRYRGPSKAGLRDGQELGRMFDEFRNRPVDGVPTPTSRIDAVAQRCWDWWLHCQPLMQSRTGVNADGMRDILGVDVFTVEDGASTSSAEDASPGPASYAAWSPLDSPACALACFNLRWSSDMTNNGRCYQAPAGSLATVYFAPNLLTRVRRWPPGPLDLRWWSFLHCDDS